MKHANIVKATLVIWGILNLVSCGHETKGSSGSKIGNKAYAIVLEKPNGVETPDGMVWIPGGIFKQGALDTDRFAMQHEVPSHIVAIDGFFMDTTEVTNAQFAKFVKETGYVTVAERGIDWEEMKKQLPQGTPKPHDSLLQPGSLVFRTPDEPITDLSDYANWWTWKIGANWKRPHGEGSDLIGKEFHPVVHIAYEDALAYCDWAGKRLPTEAEWEWAARGGPRATIYPWGNDDEVLHQRANTWTGNFPMENDSKDGFANVAPIGSYPPNQYGLYDMAGNVWELTQDWYNSDYYSDRAQANDTLRNPTGAYVYYNRYNPLAKEKVIKGGSFLCNANYCASYRISARMANSVDSAQEHLGFRTVVDVKTANN